MGVLFNPFTGGFVPTAPASEGGGGGVQVVNSDPGSPAVGDAWILHTLLTGTGDLIAGDANIEFVIPQNMINTPETQSLQTANPDEYKITSVLWGGPGFNFLQADPMSGLIVQRTSGTLFQDFVDEVNTFMNSQGFPGNLVSLLAPIGGLPIPDVPISFTFVVDGIVESVVLKVKGQDGIYTVNLT